MSTPVMPWSEMDARQKEAAVLPLIRAGESYTFIADALAAPNRHCIAGVVSRLRDKGDLAPTPSRQATGATGGAIAKAKARVARAKAGKTRAPKPQKARPAVKVSPARQSAKIIALPSAATQTAASMVEAYIAANGVRRFESGISDDLDYLRAFVGRHGYEIAYTQRGKQPYQISGGRGRPRSVDRAGLFAFVDQLRIAEGLQPFLPPKEIRHAKSA